jgi:hypothetical protein
MPGFRPNTGRASLDASRASRLHGFLLDGLIVWTKRGKAVSGWTITFEGLLFVRTWDIILLK